MAAMEEGICQNASSDTNQYARLGNFTIEKKIGRGQFSVVYRARCLVDDSIVALKKVQVKQYITHELKTKLCKGCNHIILCMDIKLVLFCSRI